MAERDGYIPGVPCWVDTSQPDPAAAARFYGGLFGWEFEDVMPGDADGQYLIGRIRGGDVGAVSSIPEGAPPAAMWNTYVWVDSADDSVAKATKAGGTVITEAFDVMDAGRMAVIADPEGAVFCVWEAKQHKGSQVVNEHGSVVFNNLLTRDPAAAERFYGAVFGWKRLDLPGGSMWALPGYGDHLEEINPGTRAMQKEMDAPEGFIDVVASLVPMPDEHPDSPPHWNITFGVDNVDAAVAKASELGGEILEGPRDAPWSREAMIRDPQGATFGASQFVPENRDVGA